MKWFIVLYTSSNWNLKILVVEERGKSEYPEIKESKQRAGSQYIIHKRSPTLGFEPEKPGKTHALSHNCFLNSFANPCTIYGTRLYRNIYFSNSLIIHKENTKEIFNV